MRGATSWKDQRSTPTHLIVERSLACAPPTTTGGYQPPRGPDDPMVVLMMASPTPAPQGDGTVRDLLRLGRHEIYTTPFATYEQQIRDQLQALLGDHGFDHETDIRAITVNRLPHGYMALDDPEWAEGQAPHEIGRAQFGRISIANSDSEARVYIDAAWRAVEEQTPTVAGNVDHKYVEPRRGHAAPAGRSCQQHRYRR